MIDIYCYVIFRIFQKIHSAVTAFYASQCTITNTENINFEKKGYTKQ